MHRARSASRPMAGTWCSSHGLQGKSRVSGSARSTPQTQTRDRSKEPSVERFLSGLPDSRNIGFFVPGQLKRVPLEGGAVQTVCRARGRGRGNLEPGRRHPVCRRRRWPLQSPGCRGEACAADDRAGLLADLFAGRRSLSLLSTWTARDRQSGGEAIRAVRGQPRLTSGTACHRRRFQRGSSLHPAICSSCGNDTLVAQPFDSERMQTRGDPQPIASDVGFTPYGARGTFSVSATGVLVYRTDPPRDRELAWLDRSGPQAERPRATRPLFRAGAVTR